MGKLRHGALTLTQRLLRVRTRPAWLQPASLLLLPAGLSCFARGGSRASLPQRVWAPESLLAPPHLKDRSGAVTCERGNPMTQTKAGLTNGGA